MKRARTNRRKTAPRRLPTLPKVQISINWRALLVPPIAALVLFAAAIGGRMLLDRPVESLVMEGQFQRVTPVQIEAALDPVIRQSFLTLDLDSLRASVAAIDWVDTVRISRVWPAALSVQITEHQAAASWGDGGLLNTRGDLFTKDARYEYAELPKLAGPRW